MIYCFDLDGTLCSHEKDYNDAKPKKVRIARVNSLYKNGNTIIIDTARGSSSGKDWRELTERQLQEWGVKYHELRMGIKRHADFYVDDKAIRDCDFFGI